MTAIEIGLGGEYRNPKELGEAAHYSTAQLFRWYNQRVQTMDPLARVECLEGLPSAEDASIAADLGMPYRCWTDLYILDGDAHRPPALELLKRWLDVALGLRTITCLNMQVDGTSISPSIAQLVEFHQRADELAAGSGIVLTSETHLNRYSEDPRRLVAVHRGLLAAGHHGLRVGADFSHYAHQIGNPHALTSAAQQDGTLRLDPRTSDDFVTTQIIEPGLIGHAHLRMAVPTTLARLHGAVQYPVVDPGMPLRHHGAWNAARLEAWTLWYQRVMQRQMREPGRRTLCMTSEFIECENEYRMDGYSNLEQNLAMVVYAQRLRRQVEAQLGVIAAA